MAKKKVLFTATVAKNHIMHFHIPYLRMLREMGWETAVAARNDFEDPAECQIPYCGQYFDVPFERMPWKPANLQAYKRLKQIIDEGNFDLIHCHTPVGAMLTRLAARDARKRGTKVMYTAHGFHFFKGAPLINWLAYYPVEWVLAHMTDLLVTINQEDYALAQKRMHAGRVVYVPGVGVDTGRFCSSLGDPVEKRRELGCGEGDFLLLTVAELIKRKNYSVVLRALALLKELPEFSDIKYLICGQGGLREALELEAERLGIRDHVLFLGYRKDISQLCCCSDVFAFLSSQEGLSVALMEAMSCGMPVICSPIRGNTDLISDGVEGLFAENDPRAVADGILKLYHDPQLRARLGKAAQEKVMLFDEENVHRLMKDLYLQI